MLIELPLYRSWSMPHSDFSGHSVTDGCTFIIMKWIVEGIISFRIQYSSESVLCKRVSLLGEFNYHILRFSD